MNFIYIGQYSKGSTSKMRADVINELLEETTMNVIDINIPFYNTNRIWRSIGFRFKVGPLINSINRYIQASINNINLESKYDFIWVDKGVFLDKTTIELLKSKSEKLIHFTPDMAFYKNKSRRFENALTKYDFIITTKTVEIPIYLKFIAKEKLIVTTQGFSKDIHYPRHSYEEKDGTVAFVGLAEPYRLRIVEDLIKAGIHVKLAGQGWGKFVEKYKNNNFLQYYGKGLFSEEYALFYSSASFGLGLLSKNFPELHTTRTFEIPACRTALLTEKNQETSLYFDDKDVIFYENTDELIQRINYYKSYASELKTLTANGYNRVVENGFDYHSILNEIIIKSLPIQLENQY